MPRRRFPVPVAALLTAALLTLTGCITVHGEQVSSPAVTRAEAKRVLERFTELNNRANEELDTRLNARIEAGGLGEIDRAGLTVRKADHPDGNPEYEPLEFSDTRFLVPKQRGWPRWFVADTLSNRNDFRWFLVFVKGGPEQRWLATHLSLLSESDLEAMGNFAADRKGYVRPVPPGRASGLTVAPGRLSASYAAFLQDGEGDAWAPDAHTTERLESRKQHLRTPDYVTQYEDEATPEYPPVALRLADGGALALFSSRHFIKQTMAQGRDVKVEPEAGVLLKGTPKSSLTLERVSQQAVGVPPRRKPGDGIVFYNRLEGLVGAEGS